MKILKYVTLIILAQSLLYAGDFGRYPDPGLRYLGGPLEAKHVVRWYQVPAGPRWKVGFDKLEDIEQQMMRELVQRFNKVGEQEFSRFMAQVNKSSWTDMAEQLLKDFKQVTAELTALQSDFLGAKNDASSRAIMKKIDFLQSNEVFGVPGLMSMFEYLNKVKNIIGLNALPDARDKQLYTDIMKIITGLVGLQFEEDQPQEEVQADSSQEQSDE